MDLSRILKFLSHPAWQGFGALSTAVGSLLVCATIVFPPTLPSPISKPKQETIAPIPAETSGVPAPKRPPTTSDGAIEKILRDSESSPIPSVPPTTPEEDVAKIVKNSLDSIGPNYHGVHQYFNGELSTTGCAIFFLVVGIGALLSNRAARATKSQ